MCDLDLKPLFYVIKGLNNLLALGGDKWHGMQAQAINVFVSIHIERGDKPVLFIWKLSYDVNVCVCVGVVCVFLLA